MKQTPLMLTGLLVLSSASVIYAAKNETGSQNTSQTTTSPAVQIQQKSASPSSSPSGVQVQNQVKTQNAGEESQLEVKTQEQEYQGEDQAVGQGIPKDGQSGSGVAENKMSDVAKSVEELLTIKTAQGVGEEIKQVAQAQKMAQEELKGELDKISGRGSLVKALIGPDYAAIKNSQEIMEQNQLRIEELSNLQIQLTNQADITLVQATIQSLIEQNTALRDQITLETQSKSMFGWLFRLFVK